MLKNGSMLIGLAFLATLAAPAFGQDLPNKPGAVPIQTTGTVQLHLFKGGFSGGAGGGDGALTYNGVTYPLSVGGVSLGTIGVAEMQLVGTASHLKNAADIAGAYTAVSASLAVAGGAKVAKLRNQNGVVLRVHGAQVGFEASLNLGGMTISLR
jgi:hypothetical protein